MSLTVALLSLLVQFAVVVGCALQPAWALMGLRVVILCYAVGIGPAS